MNISNELVRLLLSLTFIYISLFFTFGESDIFWYLYSFTLLIGVSISLVYGNIKDEIATWKYLLFGVGYGTILYGVTRIGYFILSKLNDNTLDTISHFLNIYAPKNIWHYLMLIFIIVVGEEIFWRGYVQQQLKKWISSIQSVLLTSLLFSLSIALSGFWLGSLAALVTGLIIGALYEWKKSMPLIIITHVVFILLLLMLKPII